MDPSLIFGKDPCMSVFDYEDEVILNFCLVRGIESNQMKQFLTPLVVVSYGPHSDINGPHM